MPHTATRRSNHRGRRNKRDIIKLGARNSTSLKKREQLILGDILVGRSPRAAKRSSQIALADSTAGATATT